VLQKYDEDLKITNVKKKDLFNVFLELEDQQEVTDAWMEFYPQCHISRPVTSAAEGAAHRRHFIMIGAGSGIAPYLSFLEDQLGTLSELKSGVRNSYFKNYTHAHLVFIVRSDD